MSRSMHPWTISASRHAVTLTSGPKCAGVRRMRCTIDLAHSRKEFSLYRGALRAPSRLPTCQAQRLHRELGGYGICVKMGSFTRTLQGKPDATHDDLDGCNLKNV